uniref:Protein ACCUMULATION AND REPLICATION OF CHLOROPLASTS 3 n=1 Tax=Anthurium amnicola TaxID=1678845 RepID=A0A1D1XPV4_9ARAE
MESLFPARTPGVAIPLVSPSPSSSSAVLSFPYNFYAHRGGFLPGSCALRASGLRNSPSSNSGGLSSPRDSDAVDVIAIGSRKDAFLDFCLDSPFTASSRLRFWTIHIRDSSKVQLLQRSPEKEILLESLEFPLSLDPCPAAIILVASAGHGRDHIAAVNLLNAVKLAGRLAVAVLLRPFSFEGQRRHLEVDDLLKKLQDCSIFYTVVEADALLKTEMETLAEALKSSNNAVLLVINTISVITSGMNKKVLVAPNEQRKELKVSEVLKLLECHAAMKVGFGAGYNIKSSITQAALHCPFLSGGMKCLSGTVILTLTRSYEIERSDLPAVVCTFRRITGFQGEIVFSGVYEPDLEPKLVVTTLFILGCNEPTISPKKGFLSGIALHFRFLSSLLARNQSQQSNLAYSLSSPEDALIASNDLEMRNNTDEDLDPYPEEVETESCGEMSGAGKEKSVHGFSWVGNESASAVCSNTNEEEPGPQGEQLSSWNVGPGFHIAQLWAKEREAVSGNMPRISELNVFTLPVGVKSTWQSDISQYSDLMDSETSDGTGGESPVLTLLKGKGVDMPRRRGVLSARAESMLETERESEKSWTPVIQMQYRGGAYRGRCQGGLPEGKGRLTFEDGSFYDGMWRCGRRSGLGMLCYGNGDVFQGSWRDDLMHGKGWFYFHSGDRWFANFWKGRANGEGRFYSKSGDVFFGHFRDGWRHGRSLFIDVYGSRWAETWDDGVLVKRTKL